MPYIKKDTIKKEGEIHMKKKSLLAVIMIVMIVFSTMLFGCGAKEVPTISEFFGSGKHYLCHVTGCTKNGEIIWIYFFEDGKVTKLHGEAYGCTLGDLAQMSDDEIWSKYEEVKKTYDGPYTGFNDKPVKFVIETDGTGNALEKEIIYVPSEDNQAKGLNAITFDVNQDSVGGETQIYDKNFFHYATTSGYYFCTTETIKMDDVKSKNCIIDPSSEEKNVMFEN